MLSAVKFLRLHFSLCQRRGIFSSGILRRVVGLLVADVPGFRSGLIFNGGSFATSGTIRPPTHRHIFWTLLWMWYCVTSLMWFKGFRLSFWVRAPVAKGACCSAVCGFWPGRSYGSWRSRLLSVVKWRGVGVYLLGTSVWEGQPYLQIQRGGLDQSRRCRCFTTRPQPTVWKFNRPKTMHCTIALSCPSVRIYQNGSHWTDFGEILYWALVCKPVSKIQIWLHSGKNVVCLTWRKCVILLKATLNCHK